MLCPFCPIFGPSRFQVDFQNLFSPIGGPCLEIRAEPDIKKTARGTGAIGLRVISKGPVSVTGLSVPFTGPLVPLTASVPLRGAFLHCLLVYLSVTVPEFSLHRSAGCP